MNIYTTKDISYIFSECNEGNFKDDAQWIPKKELISLLNKTAKEVEHLKNNSHVKLSALMTINKIKIGIGEKV